MGLGRTGDRERTAVVGVGRAKPAKRLCTPGYTVVHDHGVWVRLEQPDSVVTVLVISPDGLGFVGQ